MLLNNLGMCWVVVVSSLVVDVLALMAIAGRITEFGFSPNRTAALGLNIILLANLTWSARVYFCEEGIVH